MLEQEQASYRVERINELIRRELTLLLRTSIKDPRLRDMIITDVLTSRDLSSAKVFYTVIKEDKKMIEPLLDKASGFFRIHLSKTIDLRHTPILRFIFDSAPNTGARIEQLLSKL